ncbi:MAG: hypothetical protein KJ720_16595 [Proteobacteria bacterium]|nr:hypothetical protein [Pseudomonadota bacterium]MBU1449706.1 hypothetical protein [Pseudomonadota bacterium]MBU2468266.1 hypothetical protein [Pseudomonadota bacterium]MBU2517100.1 hypothetical protein [Pseudomonadota bacterium]
MSIRGCFLAALILLLAAFGAPAAAEVMPPSCPAMAEQAVEHGGCPTGAAACCCLDAAPRDSRSLVLSQAPRADVCALAVTLLPASLPAPASRPRPAPQPRARAPVPLYLATASLLI